MGKYTSGEEAVKPSNPSSGNRTLYPKNDGWYDLDALGTETKLGSGGGGGDATSIQGRAVSTNAPNPGNILRWDATTSEWVPSIYHESINYSFDNLNTADTSYKAEAKIIFEGTTTLGVPTEMKIIGYIDDVESGDVRVYDLTNGNTIAQFRVTSTTPTIIADLALANLPTTQAILEIQLKLDNDQGSDAVNCDFLEIEF